MENLTVSYEFAEPFQDDVSEKINDIIRLYDAALISLETAVSLIDYIKDSNSEIEKIKAELKEKEEKNTEMQGSLMGEFGRNNKKQDDEE